MGVIFVFIISLLTVIPHPDTGGIVRRIAIEGQVNGIIGGTFLPATFMPLMAAFVPVPFVITSRIISVSRKAVVSFSTRMCFLFGIIQEARCRHGHTPRYRNIRLITGASSVGNGCRGLLSAPERKRAHCVRPPSAVVAAFIPFINRGKAKVQQILISRIRRRPS